MKKTTRWTKSKIKDLTEYLTTATDNDPVLLAIEAALDERIRLIRRENRQQMIVEYRKEHGLWGGQIAKAAGKKWKPTKVANPIFAEALPYLRELKAKGLSISSICEKATEKYGYEFKRTWVYTLLKRDEEKHGEKHDA